MASDDRKIARHKTAIRRPSFSLPLKCLLRDGLVHETTTVFDYGCGHGQDIKLLRDMGVHCEGWDPVFQPQSPKQRADVVNLGYVINVVEHAEERSQALRSAWELAEKLLVVSAQVKFAASDRHSQYADGILARLRLRPSGCSLCIREMSGGSDHTGKACFPVC